MATTVTLDTPVQVAATGLWWRIDYPASARGIVVQSTAVGLVRWAGVVEGAALDANALGIPAGGTLSHWLPGSDSGRRPRIGAGSFYVGALAGTFQVEVTS